jgi:hypothetical protein
MLRAYKPSPLPVALISRALNFVAFLPDDDDDDGGGDDDEEADAAAFLSGPAAQAAQQAAKAAAKAEAECACWLRACGLKLTVSPEGTTAVDTKAAGGVALDLETLAEYEGITAKQLN